MAATLLRRGSREPGPRRRTRSNYIVYPTHLSLRRGRVLPEQNAFRSKLLWHEPCETAIRNTNTPRTLQLDDLLKPLPAARERQRSELLRQQRKYVESR